MEVLFSAISDITQDTSHKDMMSVVVRFTDENFKPHEYIVDLDECKDKTRLASAKQIYSILNFWESMFTN